MDELIEKLKVALADSFAFYLKAHNYHWNVEGPNFAEYHKFLGDLYEEVFGAVDTIAELLRAENSYVPASFLRYKELSTIEDETTIPPPITMMARLRDDNMRVLNSLTAAYEVAEREKRFGTSNALQDRITAHEKHGWMLRSFVRGI